MNLSLATHQTLDGDDMSGPNETKEICGHQFKTAKNGLDEAEVSKFITSLVSKNSELRDKLDNYSSLIKFAQRMVDEAKTVAEAMHADAAAEARARAASIVDEAEKAAAAAAEAVMNEADEKARAETLRLREEVERLRATNRRNIEQELRDRFDTVCTAFLETPETRPTEAAAIASYGESAGQVAPEPAADDMQVDALETDEHSSLDRGEGAAGEHALDAMPEDIRGTESEPPADTPETEETPAIEQGPSTPAGAVSEYRDEQDEFGSSHPGESGAGPQSDFTQDGGEPLYEGTVNLKIPPPVSLRGLMTLHRQLKENPDIQVGHVTGSAQEGASMELHLPARVPLIEFLRSLQGVNDVSRVEDIDRETDGHEQAGEVTVSTIRLSMS